MSLFVVLLATPGAASAHTLQPPSNLRASTTGGGVALSWTGPNDSHVVGYNVYRRAGDGSFVAIARAPGASYTDDGAGGGTYHVTAYDDRGGESAPTNDAGAGSSSGGAASSGPAASATVNVNNDYFSPSTVDVKPGGTVTWHFSGSTHTVTANAGQAETFDTTQSGGDFTHTFTQTGRFTYVCQKHSGMSGLVVVRDAPTTPDTTAPGTPAGLAATPGDGMVTLDWADVTDPDLARYTVERQNLDGSWTALGSPTESRYVDGGLTNGAAYAYRVSAADLSGNRSAPTDPATATPAATAVGPAERRVTVGGYAYGPDNLVVNKGDTAVWSWVGPDLNHSVTSAAGSAESFESHPGTADADITGAPAGGFRHTFTTTGTFSYLCRVHPDMTATITVVEGGADGLQGQGPAAPAVQPKGQNGAVPAASNHLAKVAQYKFTPAKLTIPQGDSVTWQWTGDDKDHSVSTKPGQTDTFDSHEGLKTGQIKTAPPGGKFVHTFSTLGTFTYICRLHPNMVGTVTVVPRAKIASAPLPLSARRPAVRGGRLTLRYRLGEPARMRAELRRGAKRLKTYRFTGRKGANVRRLALPRAARRAGSYRLALLATRASGDRSAPVTLGVRIPRR